jgi:hypothetical protein
VLGLTDTPAMATLDEAGPAAGLAPAPRATLTGCGCPCGDRSPAGLGVGQVLAVFGPDASPGHQQCLPAGAGHRVRVDDAQVDTGHPAGIWTLPGRVGGHGQLGGDLQAQSPAVDEQGDRPDLPGRVGQVPV